MPLAPYFNFKICSRRVRPMSSTLTERIALSILDREGIAAIWTLHVAAAEAYRTGHPCAADAIRELAEAAEEAWIKGEPGHYKACPPACPPSLGGSVRINDCAQHDAAFLGFVVARAAMHRRRFIPHQDVADRSEEHTSELQSH